MAAVRDDLRRAAGMPVADRYEPDRAKPDVLAAVRGAGVLLGSWFAGPETSTGRGWLAGAHSPRTAPAGARMIVIAALAPR